MFSNFVFFTTFHQILLNNNNNKEQRRRKEIDRAYVYSVHSQFLIKMCRPIAAYVELNTQKRAKRQTKLLMMSFCSIIYDTVFYFIILIKVKRLLSADFSCARRLFPLLNGIIRKIVVFPIQSSIKK